MAIDQQIDLQEHYLGVSVVNTKANSSMSWPEFIRSYNKAKRNVQDYRLGQHFMNLFIKDKSDLTCDECLKGLWQKDGKEALDQIAKVVEKYNWDLNQLPVIKERM